MSSLSLAMAAHKAGDLPKAERLYREVLETDPRNPDACALLGIIVGAQGNFAEARRWVDAAVEIDPSSGLLHFHRGTVLMAAQSLVEAIEAFKRAVALQPHAAQIRFNFANALRANENWDEAITQYREALRLAPAFATAMNNLALSLVHQDKDDEAFAVAVHMVETDPTYGDGWLTLCNVAEKVKNYALALSAGERAIELLPDSHFSWFGYGVALNRLNRDLEAIDAYKKALALDPSRANIWDNLAQTYQALNCLDRAEDAFLKTVEVAGQSLENENNPNIDEEAFGDRHWHLSLIELLRGKYKQGFARYRSRAKAIPQLKRKAMPCPLWKGENLSGKSLLIHDEQGYGDTLMLARFVPFVKRQGARVVLNVHPVLKTLFAEWDVPDVVSSHDDKSPACDYFCSFFDLPHRLGTELDSLPAPSSYLPVPAADEKTTLAEGKTKVGVVWGGSPLHKNDKRRSVPLALFSRLFSIPQIDFYSFNRDLKEGDADLLSRLPIKNLVPLMADFADAARLIDQMDLVITCDTATAHLAGGLGKKVWILLPFAPDWRWLTDRNDSPWYPTARLFRQNRPGNWDSVIASVDEALRSRP